MTQSTHIQLVTISAKENPASIIEGRLRDRGQPVRMQWIQAGDDLEQHLTKLAPDMIFCEGGNQKLRDYALHCCSKAAPEIPILLLTDEINAEAVDTALQKRARDAVCVKHLDHLQAVYLRELAAAKLESNLRESRAESKALQSRLASLVTVSQLAVANLQDGILIDASQDFSQLFGHASADELNGNPFLELIHPEERAKIKKLINRCASGKTNDDETETRGLNKSSEEIPLQLRLARVETDDGNCVEIQVRRTDQQVATVPVSDTAEPSPAPETEPAPVESADEDLQTDIADTVDDGETQRLQAALTSDKQRINLLPIITLDGQQSSCSDAQFEMQDEDGKWFSMSLNSRAAPDLLRQCDQRFLKESCTLLADALSKGEPSSLLVPLLPASLHKADELQALLQKESKSAIDGGQHLVLTLNEQHFIKELAPSKALVDLMRKIGISIAQDNVRGNANSIKLLDALQPDFICLDRAATQLLVSQGSEHPELAKIMQYSRDKGAHIVAFPLQDAHSMAMLWQRGVNMVRGGELHKAAA